MSGAPDAGVALSLELPAEALDALVEAVAERVLERIEGRQAEPWPEWMSVETAARYLDVSPERVRKLIARDAIPSYTEGPGCRRFLNRHELDRAIAEQRHDGP